MNILSFDEFQYNKLGSFINEYLEFLENNKINENILLDRFNYYNKLFTKYNNIFINYIYNTDNYIYTNFINKYKIHNIDNIFNTNIKNLKIMDKLTGITKSFFFTATYNDNPVVIKCFYNPLLDLKFKYGLFYEQLVYLKIKNYQYTSLDANNYLPKIYETGYINYENLLPILKKQIYNIVHESYKNNIKNKKLIIYFEEILNKLLNNEIDNLNDSSYKFRLFKNYYNTNKFNLPINEIHFVNLLLFFINIKNKLIHITIMEDLLPESTNSIKNCNFCEYYSNNHYILENKTIDFKNDIFLILNEIFKGLSLLNNQLHINHNDFRAENIIIIKKSKNKYRCAIIDFNLSYMNENLFNMSIIKFYNYGYRNFINKTFDLYIFLLSLTYTDFKFKKNKYINYIQEPNNIFTYNFNNYKILNKILFKNHLEFKDLILKNYLFVKNDICYFPTYFCSNFKYDFNVCNYPEIKYTCDDILNNKKFLKLIKKLNDNNE